MKKALFTVLLLFFTILGMANANGQSFNIKERIKVEMLVSPQAFAFSAIDEVVVSLRGENLGKRSVNPNFHHYSLSINGEPSYAWSLTVGNGLRPETWYQLPGGESVQTDWNTLAKSLFTEPGEYLLELLLDDEVIQAFTVNCLADEAPED